MHRMVALVISTLVLSGDASAEPISPDAGMAVIERRADAQRTSRIVLGVSCLVLAGGMLGIGYYGATHSNGGLESIDRIFRYISYGNLVSGSVLAIVGTVLLIRKTPQERLRDQKRLTPLVAPTRRGGLVGLATQF